jgi:hypothetical protein
VLGRKLVRWAKNKYRHLFYSWESRVRDAERFADSLRYLVPLLDAANGNGRLLVHKRHRAFCQALGLACITAGDFKNGSTESPDLAEALRIAQRKRIFFMVGMLLFGISLPFVFALALDLLRRYFPPVWLWLTTHCFVWTTALFVILLGLLLYLFRSRGRFAFGIVECGFGIYMAYCGSWLNKDGEIPWFTLLGGLFVIVRGMDNVGKSLKDPKWEYVWERVFGQDYR